MTTSILSVSELSLAIKRSLEGCFPPLKVRGEVSNLHPTSSGHLYFSLKDRSSQIRCIFFRKGEKNCQPLFKEGSEIIVYGRLSLYMASGNYQLYVDDYEFFGIGQLLLEIEELKRELSAKGLFAKEKKKAIPWFPKTIGVVTSPTGAVIHDILRILSKRSRSFHLILNPVKVQGEGAATEIAQAIEQMNRYSLCDVLIVGRGGGSVEDLIAFNRREVAYAIFASSIPIISAIGHETDQTISDLVADLSVSTPSAAAVRVLPETSQLETTLAQAKKQLYQRISQIHTLYRARLRSLEKEPILQNPLALLSGPLLEREKLQSSIQRSMEALLRDRNGRLQRSLLSFVHSYQWSIHRAVRNIEEKKRIFEELLLRKLQSNQERYNFLKNSLVESILLHLQTKREQLAFDYSLSECRNISLRKLQESRHLLALMKRELLAAHPQTILKRGFVKVWEQTTKVQLHSHTALHNHQKISLQFHDGWVNGCITEVEKVENSKSDRI